MGWSSATDIFDTVCKHAVGYKPVDKRELIKDIFQVLRDSDWDTVGESAYLDDPLVSSVIKELEPYWLE